MKKLILILAVLMAISANTKAETAHYTSLEEMVETEVQSQSDSLKIYENPTASIGADGWYLNLIRLRVRGTVGLEVPLLASFEIKPFIELRWKRKTPEGFESYNPFKIK